MMRIMAIDFGDVRTGVALSDPLGMIVGRAWTIRAASLSELAEAISAAVKENGVQRLVLGLPRNMDGSIGPRAEKCQAFAGRLQEVTGLEVVLWDERRTTVDAHRILAANGRKQKNTRQVVDAVAATLILEGYLNSL